MTIKQRSLYQLMDTSPSFLHGIQLKAVSKRRSVIWFQKELGDGLYLLISLIVVAGSL